MKYYLIDGQYKSWDYLHNSLGYTKSATESVSYNSVINWGSDAGNGYCTDTDDVEAEYFVSGVVGWYNINQLALTVHLYPSDVEDFTVEKNGVVSNAVRMILDGTEYWLIEEEVKGENPYGWMARSVAEQEGWHEYEDVTYDFILVDSTTGRITYGVENLNEIEFTPTGYFTIDEGNEVVFVEQSPFPVVCIDEGTRTPESIAPDAGFDTGLPYYASKLYIVTTDDGQGNVTRYGWEAGEEPAPSYGEDTATGSISTVTLPTEHSGSYVEAQFDSLRYYAKGTVSDKVYGTYNTYFGTYSGWYIATITWSDSSIGDLSGDIVVSDPSGSTIQQQSVFYIVFITSGITGYVPNEYVVVGGYSYNNGIHSIRVYMTSGQGAWFDQQDAGRIQIRYLDGTTVFENLSAFDLVSVSSGTLSKDTATDRYAMYNAWGGNIMVKAKYLE